MNSNIIIRPATLGETQIVADLLNKESHFFTGLSEVAAADMKTEWTIPGFDLDRDTRVAISAEGQVIGYADFYNNREPPVRPFTFVCVDPETFGDWDWKQLISWSAERAAEDVIRAPDHARVTVLSGTHEKNAQLLAAYAEAGYREDRRYYDMQIDFDEPPAPAQVAEGYQIRVMERGEERGVYDAMQAAFRDHYGVVPPSDPDKGFARWMHFFLEGEDVAPDLQIVAVDPGGNIAGGSLCKPTHAEDTEMAWVESLAVVKAHRRKGLGEALLRRSFENFYNMGKKRAGLGVDASSLTNATRLYTKCGMRQTKVFVEVAKMIRDGEELANLG